MLSGGQIHEHSNWKDNLRVHNTIDLHFSTVREARSTDRRFCFEIISPQSKRVYQALSQEDMVQWIHVISNAIESLLNGTSSKDNLVLAGSGNGNGNGNGGFFGGGRGGGEHGAGAGVFPSLLDELRARDPSNLVCADCQARNPDWCSINIGVLICIGKPRGEMVGVDM